MTAAEDRREELEAMIWRSLRKARTPLSEAWQQAHVAAVLTAADAYAAAMRPRVPRKPGEPGKPPATHYAAGSGHPACRPDSLFSARNWASTTTPNAVTCGHCRKTAAWREAGEAP